MVVMLQYPQAGREWTVLLLPRLESIHI
jgi:hypothetical protein